MAQQWLQQKLQKQKRLRRAYLKHYPSQGINQERMQTYYDRVGSTTGRADQKEPVLNNTFLQEMPGSIAQLRMERERDKDSNSAYIIWQNKRLQGIDNYHCVVLKQHGKLFKQMLFFSGNEFIFVSESYSSMRRWVSKPYLGREKAMEAYNLGKINFILEEEIEHS